VIATGGFNSNLEMVLEHRPEFKQFKVMEGSGLGAKGAGHKMIKELGGYFTHMDHIWFYVYATPDYRDPQQRRGLVFRQVPGYIWFNQQGRRFHNESVTGGASATPALLAQNPPHAWAICDTPMLAKIDVADPYYRRGDVIDRTKVQELLDNSPYIKKANTLEELGRKAGVEDLGNFLAEIEAYNECFDAKLEKDPKFGKSLKGSKKFDAPPYYAIQSFPLARVEQIFRTDPRFIRCRRSRRHGRRPYQRQSRAGRNDAWSVDFQRPCRRRLGGSRSRLRPGLYRQTPSALVDSGLQYHVRYRCRTNDK
jgi:hypothetical protein